VIGAREFRDLVIKQRDLLIQRQSLPVPGVASEPVEENTLSVLKEIRDSLWRLEQK